MKKLKKRIMSLALALTLALGCCAVVDTTTTQAATKTFTEKHNLKKGKSNTKYKIKTPLEGLKQKQTNYYYVKDLKITDAKKKGYKKATFTFVVDFGKVDLSKMSKKTLAESDYFDLCHFNAYCAIINNETGETVTDATGENVTSKDSGYKYKYYPEYKYNYNGDAYMIRMYKQVYCKFTVTYPADGVKLAFIYGTIDTDKYKASYKDEEFFDSTEYDFSDTSYYKSKKTCRYIPLN